MKVLYVIDSLEVGGAERSMLDMLPFFRNVELVVCHLYQGTELKTAYESMGAKVISLNLEGAYDFRRAVKELSAVIDSESPDVLHSALVRSGIVCRWIRRQRKILHIGSLVSDSYVKSRFQSLGMMSRMKLRAIMFANRFTARWCDKYVAISHSIAKSNAAYLAIPMNKIVVIYRGRDVARYHPANNVGQRGFFTFMNVGRLTNVKNQELLIKAFNLVRRVHHNVRLVLVGDGPNRMRYLDLVKELGIENLVELRGTAHNVPELLREADCFVMPSLLEGLGGAVIEAMLTSLPVIASDIPVFREIIADGETGILFRTNDVDDLANKMNRIISQHEFAHEMGGRARKVAVEKFDIRRIAAAYESEYCTTV